MRKGVKIIVVGIVGKIASGKSTVCSYIERIRKERKRIRELVNF